ncbi:pancreatic lipase-related protein 2-like isoform X2 [Phymastichus coffea]|uniref:pancreatic lipase-related protein 2-like isoform X2 n=1 Tax=Phymastichus coffea TaxID=108790 RepID=UPI00273CED53|nr:pancreatic lipase-related protein 2-like isoform X2 [Phymastichus coffea]
MFRGDVNVIAVDWSDGGNTWNYYKAVFNTQTTGSQIAALFEHIANYTMMHDGPSAEHWGRIHCVGHSLGAHICGYAANAINQSLSGWSIQRITGLDPAQPCFTAVDLLLRLDKSDAPFVDVIHTNGVFLSRLGLGLPQSIGHLDFFPNGGKIQPGCELSKYTIPVITAPKEVIQNAICSHGRSYSYFMESINIAVMKNCSFWAQPWDRTYRNAEQILRTDCKTSKTCIEMGINSENYKYRGTFFVLTSSSEPYCNNGYRDVEEVKDILKSLDKDNLD